MKRKYPLTLLDQTYLAALYKVWEGELQLVLPSLAGHQLLVLGHQELTALLIEQYNYAVSRDFFATTIAKNGHTNNNWKIKLHHARMQISEKYHLRPIFYVIDKI